MTGPASAPSPATNVHTATALRRGDGSGNTTVINENVEGISSAAPQLIASRATTTCPVPLASPPPAEAVPHRARPRMKAVRIAPHSGCQDAAGQREGVGVGHPQQALRAGMQIGLEAGQGHVHDGDVEADQEQSGAQHCQGPVRVRGTRRRCHGAMCSHHQAMVG